MQVSWTDRYRNIIAGLDILGVRQFDQDLEAQLVGGLTTVSPRARYLSLVPWVLALLYRRLLADGGGEASRDFKGERAVLTRLEFLVAAATRLGNAGEGGSTLGSIGSDIYRESLDALAASGLAELPAPRKPGVLAAYVAPIQGFGLLVSRPDGGPLALTPRCQELISTIDAPPRIEALLLDGGTISRDELDAARHVFSLNALRGAPDEWALLLAALDVPAGKGAEAHTERFRRTRVWAIHALADAPTWGDGLVDRAYADLVQGRTEQAVPLIWGEVALRKRVHFALEMLLASLANSLDRERGTTIEEVTAGFAADLARDGAPGIVTRTLGTQPIQLSDSWASLQQRVPDDAFLADPPRANWGGSGPASSALTALVLLAATERQSRDLRSTGVVKDRAQAMDSTFARVANHPGSVADVAVELLRFEVASRHLRHTMRKMSVGQSNSLRFFPRGDALVRMGEGTSGAFSATRLDSVLQMMADFGHLELTDAGFQPTDAGFAWARGGDS